MDHLKSREHQPPRVPTIVDIMIGEVMNELKLPDNTTTDVPMAFNGEDGVTVLGCHGVLRYHITRVPVTAGTVISVTETNGQEPLVNTTEEVLMTTTGMDDVIVWIANLLN